MHKKRVKCNVCPLNCELSEITPTGLCDVISIRNDEIVSINNGVFEYGIHYIEELGFYHFYPGSTALYLLFPGCNLRCLFCPEWKIIMKKPKEIEKFVRIVNPNELMNIATKNNVNGIVLSCSSILNYNYINALIKALSNKSFYIAMITNGVINVDYLTNIIQGIDGFLIKFFGFTMKSYSKISIYPSGHIEAINTLAKLIQMNKHVEVSYTIIAGINDNTNELNSFFKNISEISRDIPLHIKRFKPNYMMLDKAPTRNKVLKDAYKLARKFGLKYVYIDDIFDGEEKNTYCPIDGNLLIRRVGNWIYFSLNNDRRCPICGLEIPLMGKLSKTLDENLLKFKRT